MADFAIDLGLVLHNRNLIYGLRLGDSCDVAKPESLRLARSPQSLATSEEISRLMAALFHCVHGSLRLPL